MPVTTRETRVNAMEPTTREPSGAGSWVPLPSRTTVYTAIPDMPSPFSEGSPTIWMRAASEASARSWTAMRPTHRAAVSRRPGASLRRCAPFIACPMSVPAAPPPAPSEVDMTIPASVEHARLSTDGERWKAWGPYLSERAWGTVREDYSPHGNAWEYFPHDQARSKAYRWGEDGLGGICDRRQFLCFALALWNGKDPILKERLFGLTGNEGNHGEDCK